MFCVCVPQAHPSFAHARHLHFHRTGTLSVVVHTLVWPAFKVWESYTAAIKLLLRPGGEGRVLCTTISENEPFMKELLGASPCAFKPSIPNLVYQYSLYVNYDSKRLGAANPELPTEA